MVSFSIVLSFHNAISMHYFRYCSILYTGRSATLRIGIADIAMIIYGLWFEYYFIRRLLVADATLHCLLLARVFFCKFLYFTTMRRDWLHFPLYFLLIRLLFTYFHFRYAGIIAAGHANDISYIYSDFLWLNAHFITIKYIDYYRFIFKVFHGVFICRHGFFRGYILMSLPLIYCR